MTYTVYDSSVSSYYQNFIYTNDDWLAFDISDSTTLILIGSYNVLDDSIVGNTRQVVTIENVTSGYSSVPRITINDFDNREDVINFSSTTSYRIVSNIEDAPTQKNANYETSYKTYDICLTILICLIICFVFTWIKGVLPWNKNN